MASRTAISRLRKPTLWESRRNLGFKAFPSSPVMVDFRASTIDDLAAIGPSAYTPTIIHAHNLQIIDNLTKIHGKHVFKDGD